MQFVSFKFCAEKFLWHSYLGKKVKSRKYSMFGKAIEHLYVYCNYHYHYHHHHHLFAKNTYNTQRV